MSYSYLRVADTYETKTTVAKTSWLRIHPISDYFAKSLLAYSVEGWSFFFNASTRHLENIMRLSNATPKGHRLLGSQKSREMAVIFYAYF